MKNHTEPCLLLKGHANFGSFSIICYNNWPLGFTYIELKISDRIKLHIQLLILKIEHELIKVNKKLTRFSFLLDKKILVVPSEKF